MKNKLKFLIFQSLKKKMDTKWFKIANIIVLLLVIGISNIDHIVSFFGGDFKNVTKIYVIDEINSYDIFKNDFELIRDNLNDLGNYEIEKSDKSLKELTNDIEDSDDIIVEIKPSVDNYVSANITSYNAIGIIEEQLLQNVLNDIKQNYVILNSNLTMEEINALTSNVEIIKNVTNEDANSEDNDLISSGLIIVFIVPFFILITMLTQMIGAEINDEKSTRGMEIIISNVSPKTHLLAKIISSTLFVIIQTLLLFFFILIGVIIRKFISTSIISGATLEATNYIGEIFNNLKDTGIFTLLFKGLPFIILMFISSFLLYAIIAAVLASMTTNIEDFQQLQTPLMILLMVGYYIAIIASTFKGALFVKIISYIPMLSFLVAPVIYMLGQISLFELIISTILCIVTTFLFFYYGLRIYKVGILNYSSQDLWKKIFKSIKEK